MTTFHILNFGCRASQSDGAALKQQLLQAGLHEAPRVEEGAVAILNTCTVTAAADAEVRQFVRRIHRSNPHCRILVTGCYAQRSPDEIAQMEGVSWVVGNSHKHLVSAILASGRGEKVDDRTGGRPGEQEEKSLPLNALRPQTVRPNVQILSHSSILSGSDPEPRNSRAAEVFVGDISEQFHFTPVFPDDRTRPTVKIQDGCDARCSFCIIPTVRGQSRSLPPEKVLEQLRQLERAGYQEAVLSGINLGGYGRDLGRSINFLGMLERILHETSIGRVRISSIEPMDVSPRLIRLVATEPRMAQHLHVPLQSGCDGILRRMNRRYWTRQYAERLLSIHEQIPNAAIGADVMVGFPGETDQDHAASVRFIESMPYTYLHIFPYSARPGTPAATAAAQVNGRVARMRSEEIRAVIAAKREHFINAQVGRSLAAITLDELAEGSRIALTTNYLKVALHGIGTPPNQLLDVRIGGVVSGQLFGYVEEGRIPAVPGSGSVHPHPSTSPPVLLPGPPSPR